LLKEKTANRRSGEEKSLPSTYQGKAHPCPQGKGKKPETQGGNRLKADEQKERENGVLTRKVSGHICPFLRQKND